MESSSSLPVGFLASDEFLWHVPPAGHPERPDRLDAIVRHVRGTKLWNDLLHLDPEPAELDHIRQAHNEKHISWIREVCASGGGMLDEGDTHAVRESFEVARLAAGAVIVGVQAVFTGEVRAVFCAVRPPGHHAERHRPMGFCLFNNAAIGARYAQQRGMEKVAILDWDVHHGNGTQHIFEEDHTVLYISLHQYPFYPGTGAREETGIGKGKGFTLNIPLAAGTDEVTYLRAFDQEVLPALDRFSPSLIIISAGFDAHKDDPIGGMLLTAESFAKFTQRVKHIAPIVSILEGGYDLDALAHSVYAHVNELSQPE